MKTLVIKRHGSGAVSIQHLVRSSGIPSHGNFSDLVVFPPGARIEIRQGEWKPPSDCTDDEILKAFEFARSGKQEQQQ